MAFGKAPAAQRYRHQAGQVTRWRNLFAGGVAAARLLPPQSIRRRLLLQRVQQRQSCSPALQPRSQPLPAALTRRVP